MSAVIIGYFLLSCFLVFPGFAFLLFLNVRVRSMFDYGIIFLVPPISIAVLSSVLFIAFLFKLNLVVLGYILFLITLSSFCFVILVLRKRSFLFYGADRVSDIIYYSLLFVFCVGIFFVISDAIKINLIFSSDSLFHLGRINKIVVNSYADNFNPITGRVIQLGRGYMNNYYHLLIAALTVRTGLQAVRIWTFFQYMNLFIFIMLTYVFTKLFLS